MLSKRIAPKDNMRSQYKVWQAPVIAPVDLMELTAFSTAVPNYSVVRSHYREINNAPQIQT
jgi:hypothetical protein